MLVHCVRVFLSFIYIFVFHVFPTVSTCTWCHTWLGTYPWEWDFRGLPCIFLLSIMNYRSSKKQNEINLSCLTKAAHNGEGTKFMITTHHSLHSVFLVLWIADAPGNKRQKTFHCNSPTSANTSAKAHKQGSLVDHNGIRLVSFVAKKHVAYGNARFYGNAKH